jgi:hypothetical protein
MISHPISPVIRRSGGADRFEPERLRATLMATTYYDANLSNV